MGETLMQQRHVWEEAFRCVNHCREGIIRVFGRGGMYLERKHRQTSCQQPR